MAKRIVKKAQDVVIGTGKSEGIAEMLKKKSEMAAKKKTDVVVEKSSAAVDKFLGDLGEGKQVIYENDLAVKVSRRGTGRWFVIELQKLGQPRKNKPKGLAVSRDMSKGDSEYYVYSYQLPLLGSKIEAAVLAKGDEPFDFKFKNPVPVRVKLTRGPRGNGQGHWVQLTLVEPMEDDGVVEELI